MKEKERERERQRIVSAFWKGLSTWPRTSLSSRSHMTTEERAKYDGNFPSDQVLILLFLQCLFRSLSLFLFLPPFGIKFYPTELINTYFRSKDSQSLFTARSLYQREIIPWRNKKRRQGCGSTTSIKKQKNKTISPGPVALMLYDAFGT